MKSFIDKSWHIHALVVGSECYFCDHPVIGKSHSLHSKLRGCDVNLLGKRTGHCVNRLAMQFGSLLVCMTKGMTQRLLASTKCMKGFIREYLPLVSYHSCSTSPTHRLSCKAQRVICIFCKLGRKLYCSYVATL